jgi:hypothetical protein
MNCLFFSFPADGWVRALALQPFLATGMDKFSFSVTNKGPVSREKQNRRASITNVLYYFFIITNKLKPLGV